MNTFGAQLPMPRRRALSTRADKHITQLDDKATFHISETPTCPFSKGTSSRVQFLIGQVAMLTRFMFNPVSNV